ncbi:MAG: transporter substrate-binding domain-containing protein [Anaerolineales bacterium]|nr:transporter substrate-binding domain-containing protein [Anaerolineales bacterium]
MSRVFSTLACLLTLLALVVACQPAAPLPPTETPVPKPTATPMNSIRLTSGEWPPFTSENLPHFGLASRIVTEAFALKGITVEYGYFPWARSLKLAQDGEWDGSLVWHKSPEREQDFYFSDPAVVTGQNVFFHLKSYDFDWKEMKDLAGLNIGATIDYDYGEAFMQAEKAGEINVDRVPTDEQNFKKMLLGRIDIFPLDLDVGLAMLHQNFSAEEIAQITYHSQPIESYPYSLILSKKVPRNAELIVLFNAGLKELIDSGKMQLFIDESRQGK